MGADGDVMNRRMLRQIFEMDFNEHQVEILPCESRPSRLILGSFFEQVEGLFADLETALSVPSQGSVEWLGRSSFVA